MSTREIVTLQLGHYSNFVGTHWWNLQESSFVYDPKVLAAYPKEVNHDVLFREGRTRRGEVTYTPRLVLVDLNFSLGTLKREGGLYEDPNEDNIKWLGDVTLHQSEGARKNRFLEDLENSYQEDPNEEINIKDSDSINKSKDEESSDSRDDDSAASKEPDKLFGPNFYNLDNDVQVWSDYLQTGLHPKTIHLLPDHQHNNPEQPFSVFGVGQQCWASGDHRDVVEDRLRYFVEDCDQLQGFHILFDNYNAFGGLSASFLSYLADEFSSKSKMTFALTPATPPDQTPKERSMRIINSALSLHHCSENSSLYMPLSLASSLWRNLGAPLHYPKLQYKAHLDYHTSAILAASLETATLPYRKETMPAGMTDITSTFSSLGRKVSALNSSLPFQLCAESSFVDSLVSLGAKDPWTCLTPNVQCTSSPLFHSCVIRGVPQSMVKKRKLEASSQLLSACGSVDEVLRLYMVETYPNSHNAGCVMRDPLPVKTPFPHIFAPDISKLGFVINSERPPHYGVDQVPVMTSLQSGTDLHSHVDTLVRSVASFNIAKHQHFIEAGLEVDDFKDMIHDLRALAQCYDVNG